VRSTSAPMAIEVSGRRCWCRRPPFRSKPGTDPVVSQVDERIAASSARLLITTSARRTASAAVDATVAGVARHGLRLRPVAVPDADFEARRRWPSPWQLPSARCRSLTLSGACGSLSSDTTHLAGRHRRFGGLPKSGRVGDVRPMARLAVAPGEGALRTWIVAPASSKTKSSTRDPSDATAWARTPDPPACRSAIRTAGTSRGPAGVQATRA
jgi:hypothetical protein